MPRLTAENFWLQAIRCLAICAGVAVLFGCHEAPTTVQGLVTLDGKPLAMSSDMRGSVVFQPTASEGVTLTGVIDGTGHYELSSGGSGTVTPNAYWVTVSASELVPANDNQPTTGRLLTPAKYASPMDSGFRIEVVPGKNEVNLPMISDADPAAIETSIATPDESARQADGLTPKSDGSATAKP